MTLARRGFTLIELLVAITVTAIVATLVYGVADAGASTRERLAERRRALQSARAMRVVLQEALRNARPASRPGDQAFVLADRHDARHGPADRLAFLAGGGFTPLTDDSQWIVRLEPGALGVTLTAAPVGVRGAVPRVLGVVDGARGIAIRVRMSGNERWLDEWFWTSIVPAGVEITFLDPAGAIDPPIVVALPLGGAS